MWTSLLPLLLLFSVQGWNHHGRTELVARGGASLPLEQRTAPWMTQHSTADMMWLSLPSPLTIPRGGGSWFFIPAGWNPWGFRITALGEVFLSFDKSLDCDVGRFLASLKHRKRKAALKENWLEIVRASKQGQMMRIYRHLDPLLAFCLKAKLID